MADNIKVAIRMRGLLDCEKKVGKKHLWKVQDKLIKPIDGSNQAYDFDMVYGTDVTNEQIYQELISPIVQDAVNGIHGTCMAYGQTSSGKTYTMLGNMRQAPVVKSQSSLPAEPVTLEPSQMGIIHFVVQDLYKLIQERQDRIFVISVSYMEIYNERVRDLLADPNNKKAHNLAVLEDTNGDIIIKNLISKPVADVGDVIRFIVQGEANRSYGATNMNDRCSRSHTIFRISLESRAVESLNMNEEVMESMGEGADIAEARESTGENTDSSIASINKHIVTQFSHFNLVDLAGSENAGQTGATGEKLIEGGYINKSLLTLRKVITQLSTNVDYVNYRESKLTRIVQNSLGGNSKTALVCAITPAVFEETLSTLKFAQKAKVIKNKAVVNEMMTGDPLISQYMQRVESLEYELKLAKAKETDPAIMGLEMKEVSLQKTLMEQNKHVVELNAELALYKKILINSGCNLPTADHENSSDFVARSMRRATWCPDPDCSARRGTKNRKRELHLIDEGECEPGSDKRPRLVHFDSLMSCPAAESAVRGVEKFATYSKEVQTDEELLTNLLIDIVQSVGVAGEIDYDQSCYGDDGATRDETLGAYSNDRSVQVKVLEEQVLQLEENLRFAEDTLENKEQEYTEMLAEKDNEIKTAARKLPELEVERNSYKAQLSDARQQLNELRAEISRVQQLYINTFSEQSAMKLKISNLEHNVEQLKTDKEQLSAAATNASEKVTDLLREKSELEERLEVEVKSREVAVAEIDKLKDQLRESNVSQQVNDLQRENFVKDEGLQQELKVKEEIVKTLELKVKQSEEKYEILLSEMIELEERKNGLQDQSEKDRRDVVNNYEAKLTELRDDLRQVSSAKAQCERMISNLNDEVQRLKEEVSVLKGKDKENKGIIKQKQLSVQELNKKVMESEENIVKLRETVDNQNRVIECLEKNVEATKCDHEAKLLEVEKSQRDMTSESQRIYELQSEIDQITGVKFECEKTINNLNSVIESLREEIVDLKSQMEAKDKIIAEERSILTDINKRMKESEVNQPDVGKMKQLEMDLKRVREQRNSLFFQDQENKKEVEKLGQEKVETRSQVEKLHKQATDAESKVKELESQLKDIKKVEEYKKELRNCEYKLSNSERKLQTMEDRFFDKVTELRKERDMMDFACMRLEEELRVMRHEKNELKASLANASNMLSCVSTPGSGLRSAGSDDVLMCATGSGACGDLIIVQLKAHIANLRKEKADIMKEREKDQSKLTAAEDRYSRIRIEKNTLQEKYDVLDERVKNFRSHIKSCPIYQRENEANGNTGNSESGIEAVGGAGSVTAKGATGRVMSGATSGDMGGATGGVREGEGELGSALDEIMGVVMSGSVRGSMGAFGGHMGAFGMGAFGGPMGAFDGYMGAFGEPLGAFGGPMGAFDGPMGAFGGRMGAFDGYMGAFGGSTSAFGGATGDNEENKENLENENVKKFYEIRKSCKESRDKGYSLHDKYYETEAEFNFME